MYQQNVQGNQTILACAQYNDSPQLSHMQFNQRHLNSKSTRPFFKTVCKCSCSASEDPRMATTPKKNFGAFLPKQWALSYIRQHRHHPHRHHRYHHRRHHRHTCPFPTHQFQDWARKPPACSSLPRDTEAGMTKLMIMIWMRWDIYFVIPSLVHT